MSYPFMAATIGLGTYIDNKNGKLKGKAWLAAFLAIGVLVNLGAGTLWFSIASGVTIGVAFTAAFLPFIGVEAIKALAAVTVAVPVRLAIRKTIENKA
jgi:biotin transporter BioY